MIAGVVNLLAIGIVVATLWSFWRVLRYEFERLEPKKLRKKK